MQLADLQPMIDAFMARKAPCAVCGAVDWESGDLIAAPIVQEQGAIAERSPKVFLQLVRCASCGNVVSLFVSRSAKPLETGG